MSKYFFDIDGKGTSNHELAEIAHINNIDLKLEDIMMMNMLKDVKLKKSHHIILNLADSDETGTHWICLIIKGNKCLFIDSYGCVPHKDVFNFCIKRKLKLGYSKYICQTLKSVRCGLYCLKAIKFLQNSTPSSLYSDGNEYINLYCPLFEKVNEKIVLQGLSF